MLRCDKSYPENGHVRCCCYPLRSVNVAFGRALWALIANACGEAP